MARPVYSVSFFSILMTPGDTYTYAVDDSHTAVIRNVESVVITDPFGGAALELAANESVWGAWTFPSDFQQGLSWDGRVVIPPLGFLTCLLSGPTAQATLEISGYLLSS